MASTTFVNYQTVIDAAWLNDVNSAVYSGTFQASTITPTNITSSGAISGATVAGTTSVTTPIVKSGTSLTLQTNGSTTALTLDTSQNATFAGKVASASSLQLATNGTTTAVTIDTSQNLLVGTTSTVTSGGVGFSAQTDANGIFLARRTNTTSSNTAIYFYNPNGLVGSISTSGSLTSYTVSSDYRLKENIVPLTGALNKISALKPSLYNYKADPSTQIEGFIAHELAEVVPHAVTGEKDAIDGEGNPVYQGVDVSFLIPHLVASIQEQQAMITTLQSQVTALQAKG